jgi:outer membrane lipoprotein SlyB
MNTPFDTAPAASSATKPLWAAVGVLGAAVVAMGAGLVYVQTRPAAVAPTPQALVAPAPLAAASAPPALQPAAPLAASAAVEQPTGTSKPNKAPAHVTQAQHATKSVATKPSYPEANANTNLPGNYPAAAPVAAPVAKPICGNCGTVSAVTPIQRDGVGGGGGALAGGVLGAVVGNQVGDGTGKALATILGAVGGGFAGNAVEKKMKKETVYEVQVRMEDGSSRSFEQATPASVGAHVIVDGNTLQPASR